MAVKKQKKAKPRIAKKKPAASAVRKKLSTLAVKKAADAKPASIPNVGLLSTGSASFDKLLGGGIEEGSSLLILGTPHCGKKPMLMNIASAQCRRGRPVIFVLTDIGASSWMSMAKQGGWDCGGNTNKMFFVDSYARQFGACSNTENVVCLEVPFPMTSLSIETSNFIEKAAAVSKKKSVVVFHSLSTLIELFGEEETYRFVQFFVGKCRAAGVTTILSLQMGVHNPRIEAAFSGLVDGLIELKDGKLRASGYRRIARKDWLTCQIVDNKLKIEIPTE